MYNMEGIYSRELTHAVREADTFQEWQVKWPAEDPGELMVSFQSQSKGLRTRRDNVAVSVWRPAGSRFRKRWCFSSSPKAEGNGCPHPKSIRQEEVSFAQERVSLFVVFRSLSVWMNPTHIMESNLPYLTPWFKCESHLKTCSQKHLE